MVLGEGRGLILALVAVLAVIFVIVLVLLLGGILIISAFTLVCFGLLLFLWKAFGGPIPLQPQGYRVQIVFADATTLAEQADVRVAGVSVGKVVSKKLAPGGNRTMATIELKDKYAPLHEDARAILRPPVPFGGLSQRFPNVRSGRPGGTLSGG